MLEYAPYNETLLEGWVLGSGGITESTVKYSSKYLLEFIKEHKEINIIGIMTKLLTKYEKNDRVLLSTISTLE